MGIITDMYVEADLMKVNTFFEFLMNTSEIKLLFLLMDFMDDFQR